MTENERGALAGPSDVISDRSPQSIGTTRRRPFRFLLTRDDELLEAVFYGDDEQEATLLASAWAVRRGWTIEGSA